METPASSSAERQASILTTEDNLEMSVHLMCLTFIRGGNQSTWREPSQDREHANSTQKGLGDFSEF